MLPQSNQQLIRVLKSLEVRFLREFDFVPDTRHHKRKSLKKGLFLFLIK